MPETAAAPVTTTTSGAEVKSTKNFSELQTARLSHVPVLPNVLLGKFKSVDGPATTAAGNAEEISSLFPNLYGQPSVNLVSCDATEAKPEEPLRVGVVLSGGQAPGGHNVIAGIFDFLKQRAPGSVMIGFKGGPAGIMKNKTIEITEEYLYPYRNQGGFDIICSGRDKIETPEQFGQAEATCKALDLDGLVVIGGDDSNTNACLLAEYFRKQGMKTKVIGCPKTIDGDLKCKEVPISFGFDTACKTYSEMIGNVMVDARATGKYYHFIRLMGRSASHITLECALQTHPNVALIGEEVDKNRKTLRQITSYLADVVCERAKKGLHYGVFLIPEGIIDFIPEIHHLVSELNEILAKSEADAEGLWKRQLAPSQRHLFESLPEGIQHELLLERDPHGNVQVARIQSEKLLISMVGAELERRRDEEAFQGPAFFGQAHFCGYEGRCGMPSNFDSSYCYALGFVAGALLQLGQTGLIASVGNLTQPRSEWTVGGTALTSLMDIERRKGKNKPVIKKAMVELDGAPYKLFCSMREKWAVGDYFCSPGPIQFSGPTADDTTFTLKLEIDGHL